jgi:hypothetical protein
MLYRALLECLQERRHVVRSRRAKYGKKSSNMAIHAMGPEHALGVHAMTSMNIHVAVPDDLLHHPSRAFPL